MTELMWGRQRGLREGEGRDVPFRAVIRRLWMCYGVLVGLFMAMVLLCYAMLCYAMLWLWHMDMGYGIWDM